MNATQMKIILRKSGFSVLEVVGHKVIMSDSVYVHAAGNDFFFVMHNEKCVKCRDELGGLFDDLELVGITSSKPTVH